MALLIMGLLRLIAVNVINILHVTRRASDRRVPWKMVLRDTAVWLFPYRKLKPQLIFTAASFLFHVSIIVTPIFLAAHIELWRRGIGFGWAAIPQAAADYLTILAVVTAGVLFVRRISARATRSLSRPQDYLLPLLIMVPFVTGYLAMHPSIHPFDYDATMFIHVMSGNILLVLTPFSKLSHAVLFPTMQLASEMAWHLVPDSGSEVALTLDKENEPI